jgi:hypothetical protein
MLKLIHPWQSVQIQSVLWHLFLNLDKFNFCEVVLRDETWITNFKKAWYLCRISRIQSVITL